MRGKQGFFRRKAIDSAKDPYLMKTSPGDMALCKRCGAVYHEKKWMRKDELPKEVSTKSFSAEVYCPGCQKAMDKFPEGYLTIKGGFVREHKDEILRVLHNKQEITSSFNPLEQVIGVEDRGDRLEVTTTTDKFAQRIGRILKRVFNGDVEYKWSDDTKLARVVWTRE